MLDNNASLKELIDTFELVDNDLVDRGLAQTITPSSSNRILPRGNYRGDITVKGDYNLVSSNILSGKSIFGVSGSVVAGKRYATGTFQSSDRRGTRKITIGFRPKVVIINNKYDQSSGEYSYILFDTNVVGTFLKGKYLEIDSVSPVNVKTNNLDTVFNISSDGFNTELKTGFEMTSTYNWQAWE